MKQEFHVMVCKKRASGQKTSDGNQRDVANHVHLVMTSRKEGQSQSGRNGHSNTSRD